jgi:hypothetical protein
MITMSRVAADELEVQTPKSKLKIWIVEHNILLRIIVLLRNFMC